MPAFVDFERLGGPVKPPSVTNTHVDETGALPVPDPGTLTLLLTTVDAAALKTDVVPLAWCVRGAGAYVE